MENSISFIISLIVGVVSIVLAIVAIWMSRSAERESRANYERTKDVLAEIDKRASVIEKVVTENQKQLLDTVTSLLRETATPVKTDMGEQFGLALMQTMLAEPEKGGQIMQSLQPFIEMSQKQESRNNSG